MALDATDGSVAWRQPLSFSTGQNAVAYRNGRLYVAVMGDRTLYAINADSGSFLWWAEVDGDLVGSPTVHGETVYQTTASGSLYAFDAGTGNRRWTYQPDVRAMLSTPAVSDGTVFATSLTPHELPDGSDDLFEHAWYEHYFSWADGDQLSDVLELEAEGAVHAVDASDGQENWSTSLPHMVVSSPSVMDGTLCVGCFDRRLYALDVSTGGERWSRDLETHLNATPAIADGTVYMGNDRGTLYAYRLEDGQRQWIYPTNGHIHASPAVVGDMVYVNSNDDGIYGITTQGRLNWRFTGPRGDFNASSPAVVDGTLFVCGDVRETEQAEAGGVYRIDEP